MKSLESKDERGFKRFSLFMMLLITLLTFLPFVLMLVSSFTDESTLVKDGYSFFPEKFSLDAYFYIYQNLSTFLRAYGVSIFVTVVGTTISLIITAMIAYPIARKDFKYRNVLAFIVFFTMLFSGGVVPTYIMWTKVFAIQNTIAALIFPNYLLSAFNVFLVVNFFRNNVPVSLIESAQIDGASEMKIFFKIMLPLSVPVLATVGLFTALIYWNDWINALYFISDTKLYGIQNLLINLMNNIQFLNSDSASTALGTNSVTLPSTAVRMAMGVIGILPILLALPFLQKYLIKGVVIGAVKE
ncbi:carbohydrate ABC transporter permease [Robertmurraya sp.]|uniref:carbohydrate ABC transporter permease n=1 Tax=Robertmurraya sp. TaxID=2837525 RepID=UPI00370411F3